VARPGITRENVFEAAEALATEGIQPTVKLVRDRIGGSYSTITPFLATWKEERGGRGVANIPDMPESIALASRQVWAAAWKAAQDAVQTEREGLTAARHEMVKERMEMAQEIKELEGKLEVALGERETLTRSLEDERKNHQGAKDELNRFLIENARLEERVANTAKRAEEFSGQVTRLEQQLDRLALHKEKSAPPKKPS
jgi:colicin import membrane protein